MARVPAGLDCDYIYVLDDVIETLPLKRARGDGDRKAVR